MELHRDAFGGLSDPSLGVGEMRVLSEDEYKQVAAMLPEDREGVTPAGGERGAKKRRR